MPFHKNNPIPTELYIASDRRCGYDSEKAGSEIRLIDRREN